MPEAGWVGLFAAGLGSFFLMLDLSMGTTRFAFWSFSRYDNPRQFWLSESGKIILIIVGLFCAAYNAWETYASSLMR